ncbi:hypothetical protein [Muricauda sp. MAR_2010_75]|uniref:hypothetical protein n=1 Tax=Allomuricauda sp. MAR_2010_75 TaxID=1250232 RepID=UPI000568942C|nr:hypothetical protein [Muricauda sp. MAR_2010_75]
MLEYLITPYQGKPYILKVPKDINLVAFESALYNKHKNFYDSYSLKDLQQKQLEPNGTIKDAS